MQKRPCPHKTLVFQLVLFKPDFTLFYAGVTAVSNFVKSCYLLTNSNPKKRADPLVVLRLSARIQCLKKNLTSAGAVSGVPKKRPKEKASPEAPLNGKTVRNKFNLLHFVRIVINNLNRHWWCCCFGCSWRCNVCRLRHMSRRDGLFNSRWCGSRLNHNRIVFD